MTFKVLVVFGKLVSERERLQSSSIFYEWLSKGNFGVGLTLLNVVTTGMNYFFSDGEQSFILLILMIGYGIPVTS